MDITGFSLLQYKLYLKFIIDGNKMVNKSLIHVVTMECRVDYSELYYESCIISMFTMIIM